MRLLFDEDNLKQGKVTHYNGPVVDIYIVYKISLKTSSDIFTLENSLFGAVKITTDADISKYKYSGYGFWIWFRRRIYTSMWWIW